MEVSTNNSQNPPQCVPTLVPGIAKPGRQIKGDFVTMSSLLSKAQEHEQKTGKLPKESSVKITSFEQIQKLFFEPFFQVIPKKDERNFIPVKLKRRSKIYQQKLRKVLLPSGELFEGGRWISSGGKTVKIDGYKIKSTPYFINYKIGDSIEKKFANIGLLVFHKVKRKKKSSHYVYLHDSTDTIVGYQFFEVKKRRSKKKAKKKGSGKKAEMKNMTYNVMTPPPIIKNQPVEKIIHAEPENEVDFEPQKITVEDEEFNPMGFLDEKLIDSEDSISLRDDESETENITGGKRGRDDENDQFEPELKKQKIDAKLPVEVDELQFTKVKQISVVLPTLRRSRRSRGTVHINTVTCGKCNDEIAKNDAAICSCCKDSYCNNQSYCYRTRNAFHTSPKDWKCRNCGAKKL